MVDFSSLGLKKDIVDHLYSLRFKVPTEVQKEVIPLTLKNKNVVFSSQTGSGKTLAYSVGVLSKLNKKQGLQMLIVVPTRELCIQVGKEMKKITKTIDINVGVLYGGREISGDYKTLNRRNQIIVATPGRLVQHINTKKLKIGDVYCLIYDEADQMFDNGFYKECAYLKDRVSKNCQIILSSATMSGKVTEFIEKEIINYEMLKIGLNIPKELVQEKIRCSIKEKNELLLKLLMVKRFKRVIIFCNTKLKSYNIAEYLEENNFKALSMSSDLTQDERLKNLNLLKDGNIKVLVTTDVAARGLHIDDVDMVVNYDVPPKDEFYLHRVGRTARAGKKGYALTMVCPEDEEKFDNIEFDYNIKITEVNKFFKKEI